MSWKTSRLTENKLARRNLAAAFRTHILNARDGDNVASLTPVRILGSCSFLYMRASDVYILAVTKSNANAMLAFQFMTNVHTLAHFQELFPLLSCIPVYKNSTSAKPVVHYLSPGTRMRICPLLHFLQAALAPLALSSAAV